MRINIIMAQFGPRALEIEPSFSSFRKYFPEAKFILYTDQGSNVPGIEVITVKPPFDQKRYGNRSNDYFKVKGLLDSDADISICIDSDMQIVSDKVKNIIPLTTRFGMCLPCNPRYVVFKDTMIGEDSDRVLDESDGTGFAVNMTPISFFKGNQSAQKILTLYCEEMLSRPVRGPLAMWRAIWRSGTFPCLLPPQWCVCQEHCGVGDEILLHVGHDKVRRYYNAS